MAVSVRRSRKRARSTKRTRRSKVRALWRNNPRIFGGFPQTKKITLRYCDAVALNPGGGLTGATYYAFRGNSCNDPDYTGTGHQPLYYDTWCSSTGIYQSYLVLSSTIKATFINYQVNTAFGVDAAGTTVGSTVTPSYGYTCGIIVDDQNTDISVTTNTLRELGQSSRNRWKFVPPNLMGKPTTLYQKYNPKELFGIKDTRDDVVDLKASYNGNPAKGGYFIVWVANDDETTNPPALTVQIEITYNVLLTDLVQNVSQS